MLYYEIEIDKPLTYHYTGKFQSPNDDWRHIARILTDFELMVVTKGTLYISENDAPYEVREGEYFLQAPKTNQKGYKSSNCSFYWLHFSPINEIYGFYQSLQEIGLETAEHSNTILLPNTGILKNVDKIIILMKQLQDCVRSYHNTAMNSYTATTILLELYNQMNPFSYITSNDPSKTQILNDITDYIHSHIHDNITVHYLSMIFGYNDKYLSTFFHKTTGIPLKQYILKEKMEVAKGILTDSNKAISEIGYSLGFIDSHNFSKAFKKQVGLTPTEYRNTYSNRMLFYE